MRYSAELSKMLASAGAKEGSVISLTIDGSEYVGTLMPPQSGSGDPDIIVIRMKNGYDAGFRVNKGTSIKVLEQPAGKAAKKSDRKPKKGLPNIVLIATGGTIGSQQGGAKGAQSPGLSADGLLDMMPELSDIANITPKDIISVFSENVNSEHWQALAKTIEEELNNGADGIVVTHGTDTMGFTAAALSFMLKELSAPVIITGSQRSTDRPSSDAYGNLLASVRFCVSSKAAGVYVIMHDSMNDDSFAVHRGTRVRKMHTSRRDAFRSINTVPVARMDGNGKITFNDEVPKASAKTKAFTKMSDDVILLHFYPGMDPALFRDAAVNSKGIVIAGSGLGHVSDGIASLLKEAIDKGAIAVMTSQCINGPTGMNVYDTGRELQNIGVIPMNDMLPETAYVKLMWAIANTKNAKEAKELMKDTLSYEMGDRRTTDVIW
ncbi:MAG: Glu-tRNA(Gln) amidotransferase subunit GatD [Methanomassiliicoccaceae archaeon]|jgi:glutamyl-tRNA(Gln) amidotransferase subunit D|nr:Glu-tRNA(Gln) amidotransferase subunit GatD [Methanomassiliicoccaceae archaeon]